MHSPRKETKCSIIVSSFDAYSDAWHPFFTLFFRYWPGCRYPLYLIANEKKFSDSRVQNISITPDRKWAGNMRAALQQVKSPYILYMQEDYFLQKPVNSAAIDELVATMEKNNWGYVRLVPSPKPDRPSSVAHLGEISPEADYRVSLQAALWKREVLEQLLVEGETGWDMESKGTVRSKKLSYGFFSAHDNYFMNYYERTAIKKGKWMPGAIHLCRKENISIDLSQRPTFSRKHLMVGYLRSSWLAGIIRNIPGVRTGAKCFMKKKGSRDEYSKKKIIYVANIRLPTPRAHGIQIAKMCEALAKAGNQVTLVIPRRLNNISADTYSYYGIEPIFKIVRIPVIDLIKFGRIGFLIQSLMFAAAAAVYCFFIRSDIVYSRDELCIALASVVSKHCYFEAHVNRYNFLTKRVLEKSERVVTISKGLRQFYLDKGLRIEKSIVAPSGVEIATFDISVDKVEARRQLGLPNDAILLGYSGSFKTMDMEKGIDTIIAALGLIKDNRYHFVAIGGDVGHIAEYKAKAEKAKIGERVHLFSRVASDKLAIFHKACDILLMPFPAAYHYVYYMSPVKMFEYMAARRLIIASDLPSIREVLNDRNCVFCAPASPEDLAQKILYVTAHPEIEKKIVDQAFEDVAEYSWTARAKHFSEKL